jgi:hypothetical protein
MRTLSVASRHCCAASRAVRRSGFASPYESIDILKSTWLCEVAVVVARTSTSQYEKVFFLAMTPVRLETSAAAARPGEGPGRAGPHGRINSYGNF